MKKQELKTELEKYKNLLEAQQKSFENLKEICDDLQKSTDDIEKEKKALFSELSERKKRGLKESDKIHYLATLADVQARLLSFSSMAEYSEEESHNFGSFFHEAKCAILENRFSVL
jgi:predicted  nucleic acid-binding Zn-ribbon protein